MVVEAKLHPAKRRKMARAMPPEAPHAVELRPLGGGDKQNIIITSKEADFIEALYDDLKQDDWQKRLSDQRRVRSDDEDDLLELGLPVHGHHQIALFEAICPTPESPRVNPRKIASQGMVIRLKDDEKLSGWMKENQRISGWSEVLTGELDPDPLQRAAAHEANNKVRALIADRNPVISTTEEILPLYVAPPEVCEIRGRTILFGIIPVISSEAVNGPAPAIDYNNLPSETLADMKRHLSEYLKQRPPLPMPRAGQTLSANWNILDEQVEWSTDGEQVENKTEAGRLYALGVFLQQMIIELDALGDNAAAISLMEALSEIQLPTRRNAQGRNTAYIDAASFVAAAGPILIEREANGSGFKMPLEWPRVSSSLGQRLTEAALNCLSGQQQKLSQSPPKYDDLGAEYKVRGFIRVAGHDGCPERLEWSPYSEPFRILPWWDGDGPGAKISLPDLSQLKRVKPNVAFEMPPAIANLLRGDVEKMIDGEGSTEGLGLGWLCSFSIPIITLCAFIVLNIFLSLFDIFLRWMMFIKVCIPIPKKGE